LDNFLDERNLQKFAKNLEIKTVKENTKIKIILKIKTIPCATHIHEINKTGIRHL